MKFIIYCILSLIVLYNFTSAQTLSVFDVDASSFPNLKAKVFAFDENGNQITDLSKYKIVLTEDGVEKAGVRLKCPPPKPIQPLSTILTLDVSGSMCGMSLDIAKVAATAWIKLLPLGKSECAITAFRSDNYFISDFTQDRAELIKSIENLKCDDGTDFNAAFINRSAGALRVADNGKYKRVVVLLTDGFADGNKDEIINKAKDNNTTIYCVTVDNPTPEILKDIAIKTGGKYFDNVSTPSQAEDIYRSILMMAQGGDPCEIEWTSGGCKPDRKASLKIAQINLSTDFSYNVYYDKLPQIKYSPSVSVKFGKKEPGKIYNEKISITAQVEPLNIKSIKMDATSKVESILRIADYGGSAPPFSLKPGDTRVLTIEFKPDDSSYAYSRFEIESEACYGKYFYASGGDPRKKAVNQTIKLTFPNGGEELIAGSDTIITWEGVSPADNVKLEYSLDAGKNWKNISDTATGLSYKWRVPFTPSNQVLVRVTAKERYGIFEIEGMVLIPAGTFRMGNTGSYSGSWANDEKPVHEVTITKPFSIGKYEVTQKQYEIIMGKNPSHFKGDNLPVEEVSWYNAVEFCNKLSVQQGLEPCYDIKMDSTSKVESISCNWDANGYRLPTEAEWEYACKAGTTKDFYIGDQTSETGKDNNLDRIGWYDSNSGNKTHEVGQKEPNIFGLYDMSGNVWEWCWDWYDSEYYSKSMVADPKGSSTGTYRVLRGGSWDGYSEGCRSSNRYYVYPDIHYGYDGFRISRTY